MAQKRTLFAGDSEIDQIFKIFRLLGTPKESTWPGINKLSEFKRTFPKWNPQSLHEVAYNLDKNGIDLLENLLQLDPSKRITAKDALDHVYLINYYFFIFFFCILFLIKIFKFFLLIYRKKFFIVFIFSFKFLSFFIFFFILFYNISLFLKLFYLKFITKKKAIF